VFVTLCNNGTSFILCVGGNGKIINLTKKQCVVSIYDTILEARLMNGWLVANLP
jgi:hypothetical protein